MKKVLKNIVKIGVFIAIANLPFITITQLVGIEVFLDSFENTDYYICIPNDGQMKGAAIDDGDYVIIQKSSHPDFSVEQQDIILCYTNNGEETYGKVEQINCIGTIEKYQLTDENNLYVDETIYEQQVIGKVVSIVDNNLWNVISMKIWDVSIHRLNLAALFTNK
jgi:SOS-response transcriptional repressor LexA